MEAKNDSTKQKIIIETNYNEIHFLEEALHQYQTLLQSDYGINSEEEKYIGELLNTVRNPVIKREE